MISDSSNVKLDTTDVGATTVGTTEVTTADTTATTTATVGIGTGTVTVMGTVMETATGIVTMIATAPAPDTTTTVVGATPTGVIAAATTEVVTEGATMIQGDRMRSRRTEDGVTSAGVVSPIGEATATSPPRVGPASRFLYLTCLIDVIFSPQFLSHVLDAARDHPPPHADGRLGPSAAAGSDPAVSRSI